MNWDAVGAIAELLGAVGVIASLVHAPHVHVWVNVADSPSVAPNS